MTIDCGVARRGRRSKGGVHEFAREVLRPVSERADTIADPQEAAVAPGFTTACIPAKYDFAPDLRVGFEKPVEGFGIGAAIR